MSEIREQLQASLRAAGVRPDPPTREPELIAAERALSMPGQLARSTSIAQLGAALAKAQGVIQHAAKDSTNPHFSSKYADLASVADACRGALSANEIAVVQSPSADGNLVRMTTLLIHSSGEWLESDPLQVQGRDATPQAIGSCLTYLRRYQLAAMVGVAPNDDDAEAGTDHGKKQTVKATAAPVAPSTVLDTRTGEAVPAAERPKPPQGYYYIDAYKQDGVWFHVTFNGLKSNGAALILKTKLPNLGRIAKDAYEAGVPVLFTWKPNDKAGDPGWLNKIEKWSLDRELEAHTLPVEANDIPFGG